MNCLTEFTMTLSKNINPQICSQDEETETQSDSLKLTYQEVTKPSAKPLYLFSPYHN